jgi:hypothetical protein
MEKLKLSSLIYYSNPKMCKEALRLRVMKAESELSINEIQNYAIDSREARETRKREIVKIDASKLEHTSGVNALVRYKEALTKGGEVAMTDLNPVEMDTVVPPGHSSVVIAGTPVIYKNYIADEDTLSYDELTEEGYYYSLPVLAKIYQVDEEDYDDTIDLLNETMTEDEIENLPVALRKAIRENVKVIRVGREQILGTNGVDY